MHPKGSIRSRHIPESQKTEPKTAVSRKALMNTATQILGASPANGLNMSNPLHRDRGGFFAYHGLWAPGVRLFRQLGFNAKATLIAVMFLVPIVTLGWGYFNSQAAAIEFSAKERLGVAVALQAMPLLDLLQRQRLHATHQAAAVAGGRASVAKPVLATDLQAAWARLAAVEGSHRVKLDTGAAFQKLNSLAGQTVSATSVDAAFAAYSAPVDALLNLLGVATDNSNLTLDPDIDTYYLMDAAMFRLPVMIEAVAQVRGLGGAMLAMGSATTLQKRRLIEQLAILQANALAMDAGLAKTVAYNGSVRERVKTQAYQPTLKGFTDRVEASLLAQEGVQGDPAALVAASDQAIATMLELAGQSSLELDMLVGVRVSAMAQSRQITTVVLLLGLLSAAYLFISFRKVLDGGLREVSSHIQAMRDGDLTTEPRAWGADEVANLMGSLSQMQESLRKIVSEVREASQSLVSASMEISGGASDLHARTELSAANLEETASAMEQIASTVKSNQETVEEATRLATENSVAAERGGRIIGQVANTMETINASSGRIGDIIGTIDGIAFQTNILALNAAVEAARAGEQGRGFAVVAAEVRALAQRTSSAAKEIKSLITASVEQVEGGVRVVKEAGQTVGEIVSSAQRVRELLAEVAVGAREQTLGVAQSAKAVQELDSVTQQNAALVEQTAAAAAALKDQATGLAANVAQFQLR